MKRQQVKRAIAFVLTFILTVSTFGAAANVLAEGYEVHDYVVLDGVVLDRIGPVIDFNDGVIPGSVVSTNNGITIMDFGGQNVLNINPLVNPGSGHTWTLPLNAGNWNVSDYQLVQIRFDWWAEYARPWQNVYDVRVNYAGGSLFAVRSARDGNDNPPWNARVYFVGHNYADGRNVGTRIIPGTVPRLTQFYIVYTLDLVTQTAHVELESVCGTFYWESQEDILLASAALTSFSFTGARGGANWAGGLGDFDSITATYGGKISNIVIYAGNRDLTIEWEQVGSTIDFADGMPGVVNGPASVFSVRDFDNNRVLNANPHNAGDGTSAMWELPLNSGDWNIGSRDMVRVEFDFWTEWTRQHVLGWEARFNSVNGSGNFEGTLFGVRSTSHGNQSLPLRTHLRMVTSGSALGTNARNDAPTTIIRNASPRHTRYHVMLEANLALQTGLITVTDSSNTVVFESAKIALPTGALTAFSFGTPRSGGNTWATYGAQPHGPDTDYGAKISNIRVFAATYTGLVPNIYPTHVTVTPGTATVEFGAGSLEANRTATFSAEVFPINATDRTFEWSVYPAGHLNYTVNANGTVTVTGIGAGEAQVRATATMPGENGLDVIGHSTVTVNYHPAITEPMPDFTWLFDQGYVMEFGSNFDPDNVPPLWVFTGPAAGGTSHTLGRETVPVVNHFFSWTGTGSGGRAIARDLPEPITGSWIYIHFDWRLPNVTGVGNATQGSSVLNINFTEEGENVISLRAGPRPASEGPFAIGAFAGPNLGNMWHTWQNPNLRMFSFTAVETWYTVDIAIDMDSQLAHVSMRLRGTDISTAETVTLPITATLIDGIRIQGERAATINLGITNNGIDNLFFFTKEHTDTTVVSFLPYDILPYRPADAHETRQQSWFIQRDTGAYPTIESLGLPSHIDVVVANGDVVTVPVTWQVSEAPRRPVGQALPLEWNTNIEGVFSFIAIIEDVPGYAYNRMSIRPPIFVENRNAAPLTTAPRSAEWLDRGVVAVPINDGSGNLVTWRILAPEYAERATFNLFRNDVMIAENIAATNFVDRDGEVGDYYSVERVGFERSMPVRSWPNNWIDIPLQRPTPRRNQALAFGGSMAPGQTDNVFWTANDMAVADVDGSGRYAILVKWDSRYQQDPGLSPTRHTGETIFDLYTLEGELLWRINMGINMTSSAHHMPFHFFDLDQDGRAEFAVKTAEGTRIYHPCADGIVRETVDGGTPVYIIGGDGTNNFAGNFNYHALLDFSRGFYQGTWVSHPNNVWVGGTTCPVRGVANTHVTGRVNNGPEFFTVFNGLTGLPMDTVEWFAPYGINRGNWGDNWSNRADRFNAAIAFTPKNGVNGADPYPTIIEVRGHYGPHFVHAYQFINGRIIEPWANSFVRTQWGVPDGGNHQMMVADATNSGYDDIFFGSLALRHDGTLLWSADGTRGTIRGSHGDALHVGAMNPSGEIMVFTPRESPSTFNVVMYRAATGEPFWGFTAPIGDVGRGVAANITPLPGFEVWATATPMRNSVTGQLIMDAEFGVGDHGGVSTNHRIYWTGDLLSELLDGPNSMFANPNSHMRIEKLNFCVDTSQWYLESIQLLIGTLSNNGTKANPGITADLFGDWREEIIVRTQCNEFIRIYTTNIPTDYTIYTLMHDPQYRLQVSAQNSVYNQPPHLGFYLGATVSDQVRAWDLPVPNLFFPNAPDTVRVTFDANNGTFTADAVTVRDVIPGMLYGGIITTAPIPTRDGYTFGGWLTADGVEVNALTIIADADHVLYASWTRLPSGYQIFGFDIFNNGPEGCPSRPNAGLANAGTIRMWTQLDGVNAFIPYESGTTITATIQSSGECAMDLITVHSPGPGQGVERGRYINFIDADKNAQWEFIDFVITVFDQTVEVLLHNANYAAGCEYCPDCGECRECSECPKFGFDIFNNGPGGAPSRPNASLAAAGTIRMWTQFDGRSTRLPFTVVETVTATDQNGDNAMDFVRINRLWVAGEGFIEYFHMIDVVKNPAWRTITLTITVCDTEHEVLLVNANYEEPPVFDCIYCEDEGCEICTPVLPTFYLAASSVTVSNTNRHVSVFVSGTAEGAITLNLLDAAPELVLQVRDNLWTPTGPVEGLVIGVAGNATITQSRTVTLEVTRDGVTVLLSIELVAN
ncbi:MAG: InlB B-repeat-containing protein [Firmicutes bacterium]|nr:InlB B-repeat-containing protein [Bacillota bacterium]